MTMEFEATPLSFFAKLMSAVLKRSMMKTVAKLCAQDLADLKQSLESG